MTPAARIILSPRHAEQEAKHALTMLGVAVGSHARGEIDRDALALALAQAVAAKQAAEETRRCVPVLRSVPFADPSPAFTVRRGDFSLILSAPDGSHVRAGHHPTDAMIAAALFRAHFGGAADEIEADALALEIASDLHRARNSDDPVRISVGRLNEWRANRRAR